MHGTDESDASLISRNPVIHRRTGPVYAAIGLKLRKFTAYLFQKLLVAASLRVPPFSNGHQLNKPDIHRLILCQRDQTFPVGIRHGNCVNLYFQACRKSRVNGQQDLRQKILTGDGRKPSGIQRIQADIDLIQSCLYQFRENGSHQRSVGRHGDFFNTRNLF